ncbi:hypothetical protein EVAR_3676_1 [Eumeta japonica]|uniref:Uncharacterized protein n=1 Tax=Eumeta variegata TaxID=151549 RepID=A0A4C1SS47_EUMVA|nr:hypothetical protein EVAR_3676_1 [Eumeta japonica]
METRPAAHSRPRLLLFETFSALASISSPYYYINIIKQTIRFVHTVKSYRESCPSRLAGYRPTRCRVPRQFKSEDLELFDSSLVVAQWLRVSAWNLKLSGLVFTTGEPTDEFLIRTKKHPPLRTSQVTLRRRTGRRHPIGGNDRRSSLAHVEPTWRA